MRVTAYSGQSLWDLCLEYTGTIAGVYALALANDLCLTDPLHAGQPIEIPDALPRDEALLRYYRSRGIRPATGLRPDQQASPAAPTPRCVKGNGCHPMARRATGLRPDQQASPPAIRAVD